MGRDFSDLDLEKSRIVRELFVDTADDNYITARWCYSKELNLDYYWLAVHALEKYLKATLLLNGHSSRGFRHDVVALYAQVQKFAGDLLPVGLDKPDRLGDVPWRKETPEAYLARLLRGGNADNRYLIYGYLLHMEDLFKLDRMVFAVRRLCCVLDARYLRPQIRRVVRGWASVSNPDFTCRDLLLRQPDYWEQIGGKLGDAVSGRRGESLRHVVLNYNLPFAPPDYAHKEMRVRYASHTPVLFRAIVEPLRENSSAASKKLARETCDWVLQNVQLPEEVRSELEVEVAKHNES